MSDLGDILRNARHKKGVTLGQAAEATRIKRSFLEALEDDEFGILPGAAYVTGFLRNYASYLGLHPDDIVQEYYATYPPPQPTVKAATRVLANGRQRYNRTRLFWGLAALILLLAAGYAIQQYNNTYAHSYNSPLNVTPANLGATVSHQTAPPVVKLRLRPTAPVWVRVTADGRRLFQGTLHPRPAHAAWIAHRAIFVFTYEPSHLKVIFDGRHLGRMGTLPGLTVDEGTPSGWQQVS